MTWANKAAFILICSVMAFTTVAYGGVHQPILAIFYIAVAALLVLWAVDGAKTGVLKYSPNLVQLPIILTALYGFVQVIPFGSFQTAGLTDVPSKISLDPFATQVNSLHFAALFIFLAVLLTVLDSAGRIRRFAAAIGIFGTAFAFFGILQSVLSPDKIYGIYEAKAAPPFGSFINRHNFAAFMEMSLALPLGMLFAGVVARDKRLLFITAAGLMGISLIMSGSRGGLVALAAEVIFIVIVTMRSRRQGIFIKAGLAALMLAAIIAGSFFIGGESSLTRLADTARSADVTTDRSHIWNVTLKMIAGNMPFGVGLGAYGVAYTQYDDRSGLERVEQAHNDYLQVLSDAGIVGAVIGIFFLAVLGSNIRQALAADNALRRGIAAGASAGVFAVLVHSLFDFVLHTTAVTLLFLGLVGLVVACRGSYEDDIPDAEREKSRRRSRKATVSSIAVRRDAGERA